MYLPMSVGLAYYVLSGPTATRVIGAARDRFHVPRGTSFFAEARLFPIPSPAAYRLALDIGLHDDTLLVGNRLFTTGFGYRIVGGELCIVRTYALCGLPMFGAPLDSEWVSAERASEVEVEHLAKWRAHAQQR